jgi:virulence factor Mce-like protein
MGVSVGTVNAVDIDGNRVRVRFSVNRSVPIPTDVTAAIMPLSLIGERNLALTPPWTPGKAVLPDGSTITKTRVPIEVDDILKSVTQLADALNPKQVSALITGAASALQGRGATLNDALQQASSLTGSLAQQDQQLLEIAANIHQLAAALESRQQELGTVIEDFSQATEVLAQERQQLIAFLAAVANLAQQGELLVTGVSQQLPGDVATLTKVVLTLEANAGAVKQLVTALGGLAFAVTNAYDPGLHAFVIRLTLSTSAYQILSPLLGALGVKLPCLPLPGQACT